MTRRQGVRSQESGVGNWRPGASLETLKVRAELFRSIRTFFNVHGVMEVDTPILSRYAAVDRHIESFTVSPPDSRPPAPAPRLWLHTSPEFAMKRLLSAGAGSIYQICHVFRAEEAGRLHNPEFAMLEWYRAGWDHHQLMDEVETLLAAVGGPQRCERLTYSEAFLSHAGFDPLRENVSAARLALGRVAQDLAGEVDDWDGWLDVCMSLLVGPKLGVAAPCLLYDFPASQAALARVRPGDPPVAERFELFWKGIELANGFHELTDATQQRARFEADQAWRKARGRAVPPSDTNLIAALQTGLPACAGVAVGLDRLLMLLLDLPDVASAIPFSADRA
jgi:lysyl-tRNA synthetase class 2